MCDEQSLRSACSYAQSDQSLFLSLEYSMSVKLLTEHYLEFLSLKAGYRGSSESTLVKISICWKSHATAHFICDGSADEMVCSINPSVMVVMKLLVFNLILLDMDDS